MKNIQIDKKRRIQLLLLAALVGAILVPAAPAEALGDQFPKAENDSGCWLGMTHIGVYCRASTDVRLNCDEAENWNC